MKYKIYFYILKLGQFGIKEFSNLSYTKYIFIHEKLRNFGKEKLILVYFICLCELKLSFYSVTLSRFKNAYQNVLFLSTCHQLISQVLHPHSPVQHIAILVIYFTITFKWEDMCNTLS